MKLKKCENWVNQSLNFVSSSKENVTEQSNRQQAKNAFADFDTQATDEAFLSLILAKLIWFS
jgi:hypothetical protein